MNFYDNNNREQKAKSGCILQAIFVPSLLSFLISLTLGTPSKSSPSPAKKQKGFNN